jgi:acyl-CoA synthetase (AMP-forming)/AMP-acid ligase II
LKATQVARLAYPSVTASIVEDPEQTAEAVDDAGWMLIGDLVSMDEAGYCRLKDMIKRFPREIKFVTREKYHFTKPPQLRHTPEWSANYFMREKFELPQLRTT